MATVMSARELNDRMVRIMAEYREMPGLCLTPAQAARLWDVEPHEADRILCQLEAAGMLARTSAGSYRLRSD